MSSQTQSNQQTSAAVTEPSKTPSSRHEKDNQDEPKKDTPRNSTNDDKKPIMLLNSSLVETKRGKRESRTEESASSRQQPTSPITRTRSQRSGESDDREENSETHSVIKIITGEGKAHYIDSKKIMRHPDSVWATKTAIGMEIFADMDEDTFRVIFDFLRGYPIKNNKKLTGNAYLIQKVISEAKALKFTELVKLLDDFNPTEVVVESRIKQIKTIIPSTLFGVEFLASMFGMNSYVEGMAKSAIKLLNGEEHVDLLKEVAIDTLTKQTSPSLRLLSVVLGGFITNRLTTKVFDTDRKLEAGEKNEKSYSDSSDSSDDEKDVDALQNVIAASAIKKSVEKKSAETKNQEPVSLKKEDDFELREFIKQREILMKQEMIKQMTAQMSARQELVKRMMEEKSQKTSGEASSGKNAPTPRSSRKSDEDCEDSDVPEFVNASKKPISSGDKDKKQTSDSDSEGSDQDSDNDNGNDNDDEIISKDMEPIIRRVYEMQKKLKHRDERESDSDDDNSRKKSDDDNEETTSRSRHEKENTRDNHDSDELPTVSTKKSTSRPSQSSVKPMENPKSSRTSHSAKRTATKDDNGHEEEFRSQMKKNILNGMKSRSTVSNSTRDRRTK